MGGEGVSSSNKRLAKRKVEIDMGKLYFVRHGESEWNTIGRICGATDIPLTDRGRAMARETACEIVKEEIKVDRIISSPLSRAYETATIIGSVLGVDVKKDDRIKEQNFGVWEGQCGKGNKEFQDAKRMFCSSYSGGESMMKTAQRVYNLIDEVKKDKDNTYLLVAHNGIYRIIQSYFFDLTNEEFASQTMPNCAIKVYDI